MTEEQKGCYKNSRGCKDQIIIDEIINKQATKTHRNLNMAYVDYKKAFDSVPHSYLIDILEIYKIDQKLIIFLQRIMTKWSTILNISDGKTSLTSRNIKINRGIFQGDSLSALWFCIALNPLSNSLNDSNYGYNLKNEVKPNQKVTHLLYMDDLKLYSSSKAQLHKLLEITYNFSKSINMEFGIEKCKTIHLKKGKLINSEGFEMENNEIIENLTPNDSYKYLGYSQLKGINHTAVKENLLDLNLNNELKIF